MAKRAQRAPSGLEPACTPEQHALVIEHHPPQLLVVSNADRLGVVEAL